MRIGKYEFDTDNHSYIMGILNVTPDSFSDGGKWNSTDAVRSHVEKMVEEGVDVIDVGGESTRPGYTRVSDDEEINRVTPVIELIKRDFDVPVSIDTYKSSVATEALKAGADMVNDIWGFKYDDSAMAETVAKYEASCVLMHNCEHMVEGELIEKVMSGLRTSIEIARKAGISDDRIMVDPGIGFAKDYNQNLIITKHLEELKKLGYPVVYAASRKSMIGNALNLPVEDRLEGTLATTAFAVMKGAAFVRVHDVKENKRVIQMLEAIRSEGR